MQLSPHFTLEELIATNLRLYIQGNKDAARVVMPTLSRLANEILEPAREILGVPITITSGYRCPALNHAIGGASTSQHMLGEAADTVPQGMTLAEAYNKLAWSELPFGQIIFEFGSWIHLSLQDREHYPNAVRERLVAKIVNGATAYFPVSEKM